MNFYEYQQAAARTSNSNLDYTIRLAVAGLGLSGEAGEVSELIKKYIGHDHTLDRTKLVKELGDVLWYIAELCTILDINMTSVPINNVRKLKARYPIGFEPYRSINKDESNE